MTDTCDHPLSCLASTAVQRTYPCNLRPGSSRPFNKFIVTKRSDNFFAFKYSSFKYSASVMIIVLICYLNSIINTYITCIDSADSPLGISLRSPLLVRSPPTSCSSSREESSWDSFQPLLPEVCLSQIWQETQIAVRYTKLLIAGWRVSLWELVLWLVILFQTSKYLHVHTLWNPTIQPVFLKLICTSQQVFLYNNFVQRQETFRSDWPKWPDRSKWTTFEA